jgi:DNA-binding XRE family transcriptional regulator
MQAVVKAPRINVVISGYGIKNVIRELKKKFTGIHVEFIKDNIDPWINEPITKADDHETVNPFATAWFKETMKNLTPGDRLDAERFKCSMTQNQLSELTGIPQHHISEMESGKRPIGKATAKKLAKVFKKDYRIFL